jgi:diadenosine tetraphosphate (Ap4A) HIT family hydrolase
LKWISWIQFTARLIRLRVSETWSDIKARGFAGRLEAAHQGLNPTVIARVPSGWAVLGDGQRLPGYSLILSDPLVPSLNDLPHSAQMVFLRDVALLGRASEDVTDCARVNYGIYGNSDPYLHAHVFARYAWEEPERARVPVWKSYSLEELNAEEVQFSLEKHGELRDKLEVRLLELLRNADLD